MIGIKSVMDKEQCGYLEIVIGPMWSSKSKYLASKVAKYTDLGMRCLIVNHTLDDRKSSDKLHNDGKFSQKGTSSFHLSKTIHKAKTSLLKSVVVGEYDVIAVDECQFFDEDIIPTIKEWVNLQHKIVICAGLDGDAQRRTFGHLLKLVPEADKVKKLRAQCMICMSELKDTGFKGIGSIKANAPFTALTVKDYDSITSSQVRPGGSESYTSMCRYHHNLHTSKK